MLITPPPTTSKRDIRGREDHRRPERDAHCHRAVVRSGHRIPEKHAGTGRFPLREIPVLLRLQRALRISNHRPRCATIPPWCACLRLGLSSGAFRLLKALSAASTDEPSAWGQAHLGAGGSHAEPDASVYGFPEQGRQLFSWRLVMGRYVGRCAYAISNGHNIPTPNRWTSQKTDATQHSNANDDDSASLWIVWHQWLATSIYSISSYIDLRDTRVTLWDRHSLAFLDCILYGRVGYSLFRVPLHKLVG